MNIAENLALLQKELPAHVRLIAVSKTMSPDLIRVAYDAGQRAFGENKVQELQVKQPVLPGDIEWHMIGHLQTNKVKYIVSFIHLIHSVDSLKLLSEINNEGGKINRIIDCLLQIRIAKEETKYGMPIATARELLETADFKGFKNVRLRGLMGMATFTDDTVQVTAEFKQLAGYFKDIKQRYFTGDNSFAELSMGMSGDYKHALDAGSTMVRIGSLIFGERNYNQ
ncbi:MAG: YggS family pyridoxal phosphate-dependent enzyme [Bacteroidales bacterium]|nr:YggS family pyridoxal phosphate-dependent enzyme [Bacteroidales bacterium]